jgi:hypothetical protein
MFQLEIEIATGVDFCYGSRPGKERALEYLSLEKVRSCPEKCREQMEALLKEGG